MNILAEIKGRFAPVLAELVDDPAAYLDSVRRTQDSRFGDYQADFAMALGRRLKRSPREVAAEIAARAQLDDLCEPPEVAGPGFINLRLRQGWLEGRLDAIVPDERLGIAAAARPRTYVIDYSSPNVAKPMHVGHIRSTVIGDGLKKLLRFLGHTVISDNHLGDWGTQFGMIIYGYKLFLNRAAHAENPVEELGRLYRFVNTLVEHQKAQTAIPALKARLATQESTLTVRIAAIKPGDKRDAKEIEKLKEQLQAARDDLERLESTIASVAADHALAAAAAEHPQIAAGVLEETAKLHSGDPENVRLWREFLPPCTEAIDVIYRRLGVEFDVTLGESFYHDRLSTVVEDFLGRGLARESEGAIAVFLEGFAAPMLIRKQDGAFLYATSDLATIAYRMKTWSPDAILYVVDHRQSNHFDQLFAAARLWGHSDVELAHIQFGTVLGDDGRPFKTRSGDTVGLAGLLDEAVRRAALVIEENAVDKADRGDWTDERKRQVAEVVGIGAIKYADLSQNRTSDYVFSYDKMLATKGNTATYMQYAYARVRSIFAKGGVDPAEVRASGAKIALAAPAERALGIELLRFAEALDAAVADYRPHLLAGYLFELANRYSTFFDECPVLKAATPAERAGRLLLCDLTARTIERGLELLGIDVVEKM